MERKNFIKKISTFTIAATFMKGLSLNSFAQGLVPSKKMPVLFVGHGSPMNAIESNEFTKQWQTIGKKIPRPQAILCVSAHWETAGTLVTAMSQPRTIHDFGGFPRELYEVQYPAQGNPQLANNTRSMVKQFLIDLDKEWGLDHGCWSILKQMYPQADVPVIQLSLDYKKDAEKHYQLAKELSALREKGVLIIASGNIVHNLGLVDWNNLNTPGFGFEWALEAKELINKKILSANHQDLINYNKLGRAVSLAVPSPEHYLPLLYALALQEKSDKVSFFNDKTLAGSLSMTSLIIEQG